MKRAKSEMNAIALSEPKMLKFKHPITQTDESHLGYEAEVEYKTKPNERRFIMCSQLDRVNIGEPVMLTWHSGMRAYQHSRSLIISNPKNCIGGFYYTNGSKA